jgi:hypothetical protein
MIRVICPKCAKKLGIDDRFAGKAAVCPRCKTRVQVPVSEIPLKEEPEEEKKPAEPTVTEDSEPPRPAPAERPRKRKEKHLAQTEDPENLAGEKPVSEAGDEGSEKAEVNGDETSEKAVKDDDIPEDWVPQVVHEKGPLDAFMELDTLWQVLLGLVAFCVVLSMVAVSMTKPHTPRREMFAYVVAFVGLPILTVGWLWYWGRIFNESILQGIFCLFPPYAVYYFMTHTEEVQRPFYVAATGTLITMMFCMLFYL